MVWFESRTGKFSLQIIFVFAVVAQLGERSTEDAEVGCSIHPDGTTQI